MKIGDKVRVVSHPDPRDAEFFDVGSEAEVLHIKDSDYYGEPAALIRITSGRMAMDGEWWTGISGLEVIEEA